MAGNIANWFSIDGVSYDVVVLGITETAEIRQSENAGETLAPGSRMTLDPLGTFITHTVTVKRKAEKLDEYDRLYEDVIQPRTDGVMVKVVHNQTTINYEAYITAAEREVKMIDDVGKKVYWKEMTITMTPIQAQVILTR